MRRKGARTDPRHAESVLVVLALVAALASACASRHYYPPPPPDGEEAAPAAIPPGPPAPEAPPPVPPPAPAADTEDPLAVQKAPQPLVVVIWAEPRHLPEGGGVAQILVRVHASNGNLLPGVEVRLATSEGTLFSEGRVLVTNSRGMTRDRITTRQTATITLNVGGSRYTLEVPVGGTPRSGPMLP